MNKRLFAPLATVALAGGMLAATPAEATSTSHDTSAQRTLGCVSKAEFRAVRKGWSISRTHRVFDTTGKQSYFISGSPYYPASQSREYRACTHPQYSYISVDFERRNGVWRVTDKMALWF